MLIIGTRGAARLHPLPAINNATIEETDVLTCWQGYFAESQMALQCQITLKFNDWGYTWEIEGIMLQVSLPSIEWRATPYNLSLHNNPKWNLIHSVS